MCTKSLNTIIIIIAFFLMLKNKINLYILYFSNSFIKENTFDLIANLC